MSKMLFELKAPLAIAQAREDMGVDNIWKYLRYYRMFLARFNWIVDGVDLTKRIEYLLFWAGKCVLYKDPVLGVVVGRITDEVKDPNDNVISVNFTAENNYRRFNKKVGKDVVIIYADESNIAPVLYIWAIAKGIINTEEIIDSQDNMLRKPIAIAGKGEDFDNASALAENILSGVAWINTGKKGAKGGNILQENGMEVLNLQAGNAYKGKELWDSRSHREELIKDYLGYMTVNNEKKERMITDEVNESNAVCNTFYKSAVRYREQASKEANNIGITVTLEKNLELQEQKEEVSKNDNREEME